MSSATKAIEVITGSRPGAQGVQGYAPVLATVVDGTRIVLKVTDWTGGLGTKPPINLFLTAGGYTADINAATNIRGSGAVEPGDNVILSGSGTVVAKNHSCYFVNSGTKTLSIPIVSQVSGFDFVIIANQNSVLYISAQDTNVKIYMPSSRSIGSNIESVNFVETYAKSATENFNWLVQKGIYNVRCFNDGTTTHIYVF